MSDSRSASDWSFRSDVEGLRAIAILLVVAYHAHLPVARGGFIGVDVFFVLSGFLITGILVAEVRASGRVSLTRFWARRARRLLPGAAVVVVTTLVASALVTSPYERVAHAKSALAFAVYVSNLWFVRQQADYFADDVTTDPLLHTWSLSIEEQFYLLYAPLIALMAWGFARRGAELVRSRITPAIAALTILSLAGCLLLVRQSPVQAFYLLPTRAWEFGAGALLALAPAGAVARRLPLREPLSWLALGGLVASGALIGQDTQHPGVATILPVLCTVVLIASGPLGTGVSRMLSTRPMRGLGRLSYSWYLWHWPPLVLLTLVVGELQTWQRLVVVVATLLPAALAYRFVEQPVRESRWLALRPKLSIAGGVALGLVVASMSFGAWRSGQRVVDSSAFAFVREARAQPRIYADGCHAEPSDVDARPCVYGVPDGDSLIVLFGDSHAAHWFPTLEHVARTRGWRLVPFTKSGCPSVAVTVHLRAQRRRYAECDAWRADVLAWLARERPAIVLITNHQAYGLHINDRVRWVGVDPRAQARWRTGLRETIAEVHRTGARVVLLQDSPFPRENALSCLSRAYRHPERCALQRSKAVNSTMETLERAVAAAEPPASFISMTSYFCDARTCPVVKDGMAVFRDGSHLTVSFAARLGAPLDSAIRGAMTAASSAPSPRRARATATFAFDP
jgi:peptidoglycan/LPS O-acetylase OafA/YrhL